MPTPTPAPLTPAHTLASRLLLVDDEPVVRDVIARLLAREPALSVVQAASVAQARELLEFQRFDVLLADKNLPGPVDGIALIAEACQRQPHLEAMVITGYATPESVVAAMAAGASDYLVKPFEDLAVLRAKVRAALERRGARLAAGERAQALAREAAGLLASGRTVAEPTRARLRERLTAYERAIVDGAQGNVAVTGPADAALALEAAGVAVRTLAATPATLAAARPDLVLLDARCADWRALLPAVRDCGADALLLARPDADLVDLLDALELRLDPVRFEPAHPRPLAARVRAALMRRSVHQAQELLAEALADFRLNLGRRAG